MRDERILNTGLLYIREKVYIKGDRLDIKTALY